MKYWVLLKRKGLILKMKSQKNLQMKEKIIYKGFVEKNNDLGFLFCVSDFSVKKNIHVGYTEKL